MKKKQSHNFTQHDMASLLEDLHLLDRIYLATAEKMIMEGKLEESEMYEAVSGNLSRIWRQYADDDDFVSLPKK